MMNVRANDIEYNPLVMSYLLVSQDYVKWFVKKSVFGATDPDTIDSYSELKADGVEIEDYDAIYFALSDVGQGASWKIYVDHTTLNYHLAHHVMESCPDTRLIYGTSPVILEKAVKTESEIGFLRQTYVDDGIALKHQCTQYRLLKFYCLGWYCALDACEFLECLLIIFRIFVILLCHSELFIEAQI